jgi:hypothetical protein
MTLEEFAQQVQGLSSMSHAERIKHLAWFLSAKGQRERFETADIRRCYAQLHYDLPGNLSQSILQLTDKRPPVLLKDKGGFRLHASVREKFDAKYALRPIQVAVPAMLQSLIGKVSDEAERLFLKETVACYGSQAFRATVVMAWNLAYSHLLNHILDKHLVAFNAAIVAKFPKRANVAAVKKDDFLDEFGEFEVIEVASKAGIVPDNMKGILKEKLAKRNRAAHPSALIFDASQAEEAITDLVNNVILKLA